MITPLRLVCPYCRHNLTAQTDALRCDSCQRDFPVIAGIPDLRVAPDPWIDVIADRAKGIAVGAQAAPGLEGAVREYWRMTPKTGTNDAERHTDHVLHAVARTREWVTNLQPTPVPGEAWLDLGCGTADLTCAVPEGVEVTGLDVAFRWLVVATRRLTEEGRSGPLICGNAEALPFPSGSFDRVVALGTLEQCQDLNSVLSEVRRVLRPGGRFHARSSNRFTLLSEPHVGIWGVGFVPRAVADRYVRWRGGGGYQHHWPHSAAELHRALKRAGFVQTRVLASRMLGAERNRLPGQLSHLAPAYDLLRRTPLIRQVARTFAPLLDVEGVVL